MRQACLVMNNDSRCTTKKPMIYRSIGAQGLGLVDELDDIKFRLSPFSIVRQLVFNGQARI